MQIAATRLGDGTQQFLIIAIANTNSGGDDAAFEQGAGMAGNFAPVSHALVRLAVG